MIKYIAFDIDCNKTVCCIIQQEKNERYQTIPSTIAHMREFLRREKADGCKIHLVFEISGQAGFLYDSLINCADSITVANPIKMTWIYRTTKKNDRFDARKMAVLLSIGEIPAVHMPSRAVRQWRQTILHRKKIVVKVTQVKNRIRALLKSVGINRPYERGSWWKMANRAWMRRISQQPIDSENLFVMHLDNLLEEMDVLESQLKRVTKYLDDYLANKAQSELLLSIPGVGPRTTEAVLAYTDDVARFGSLRQYGSYFGLTPRLDESGTSRRLGHISKHGPSVVRWVLCESSWKVIRKSKSLRAFYERVMCGQASRKKIAIIAVCRKLLSIMRAMLRDGKHFSEELAARECSEHKQVKDVA